MGFDSSKTSVGIATEVPSGTFAIPSAFIPYETVTIGEKFAEERDEASKYGVTTTPVDNLVVRRDGVSGVVGGVLTNLGPTDRLLHNAFGAKSSAVSGTAGYTIDTYTIADGGPSHTVQVVRPRESKITPGLTIEDTYTNLGCRINQFTMSAEVEKTLKFSADYIGRQEYILPDEVTGMSTAGAVGVLSGTVAGTAVSLTDTSNLVVGMTLFGGGFPGGTTVTAIGSPTAFTASAAGTAGIQTFRVGFTKGVAAYTAAARTFRGAVKKMAITIAGTEYCFGSYTLTLNNNLSTEKRSCGTSDPTRLGPRTMTLSVQNLEYDLKFRDWLVSNTPLAATISHVSTFDVNTTLNMSMPAVRVKGPSAPDLAVGTAKLTVDLDLEIFSPAAGSDITVALQRVT